MNKPRAVFFGNRQDLLTHVYPDSRVERLKALADVHPVIVSKDNFDDCCQSYPRSTTYSQLGVCLD